MTDAGHSAWTEFDWSRERYEDLIRHVVPEYDRHDSLIVEAVRDAASQTGGERFRILELGPGTGSLACFLLEAYSHSVVTVLDVSPRMLAECGMTLAPYGDRARVVEGDVETADLRRLGCANGGTQGDAAGADSSGTAEPAYHAIVSRLAVHHLDAAGQERLACRIFAALEPGGVFVNSDMIAAEDETDAVAMMHEWRCYVRSRGDDPDEWEPWLMGEDDRPATEAQQHGWLSLAGFAKVETIWKMAGFAILRATKALGGN